MIKRKKADIVQFKIRLTEDLRKQLETAARAGGRSLNTEMVQRLKASLGSGLLSPDSAKAARELLEMHEKIAELKAAMESIPSSSAPKVDEGTTNKPESKWGKK
jgi:hypothetical protein